MGNKQKRSWIEMSLESWKATGRVPGHGRKKSMTASTKTVTGVNHTVISILKNVQQSTHNLYPTQRARVRQARYLYLPLAGREGFLDMKSEPLISISLSQHVNEVAHQKPVSYCRLGKPSNFQQPINGNIERRIYNTSNGLR